MPVTYEIVAHHRLCIIRHAGVANMDETLTAVLSYGDDPLFEQSSDMLVDLRNCRLEGVFFQDIQRIILKLKPFCAKRANTAALVFLTSDKVNFGIARMYQTLVRERETAHIEVCSSPQEALSLLGRSEIPEL